MKDGQANPSKRRRKLKYETVPEDWGCGEDVDRMEKEEEARGRFLNAGGDNCVKKCTGKQTIIRTYSQKMGCSGEDLH